MGKTFYYLPPGTTSSSLDKGTHHLLEEHPFIVDHFCWISTPCADSSPPFTALAVLGLQLGVKTGGCLGLGPHTSWPKEEGSMRADEPMDGRPDQPKCPADAPIALSACSVSADAPFDWKD